MNTGKQSETTAGKRNPGDEAEPGTEQTGEMTCPLCHGSGKTADSSMCRHCGGSGMVVVTVGDA